MQDIYYEIIGEGFPIVVLHGNGENHHLYDHIINRFKDTYKFIAIDSRYHGKSIHQGNLSYEQLKEDTLQVINELNLKEYALIGFSDGGIVGLLMAQNDERIKSLVTIGPNTSPKSFNFYVLFGMWLNCFCLLPFSLYNKVARNQLKRTMLMIKEPHITQEDLELISCPTLVMAGEYDMIKKSDFIMISECVQDGQLEIIKGQNHSLLKEPSNYIENIIMNFIKERIKENKDEEY